MKMRFFHLVVVLLVCVTGWSQPLAGQEVGAGLARMSQNFAMENMRFGMELREYLGIPAEQILPQVYQKEVNSFPFPGDTPETARKWGPVELADKRIVFLDQKLYAVEMDFAGKRNTLAILDQTREQFGARESVRGNFGIPKGPFDNAPQELIKQWESPRLTAILTYWDNLEGGTLRIVDRERHEARLAPQRESSRQASGRLGNSIMDLDWGGQRIPPVQEEDLPELPQQDDGTESAQD